MKKRSRYSFSLAMILSLALMGGISLLTSGCAKKPLSWSRELDRKALKVFNEGQTFYNQGKYWSARRRYKKVISKFSRSRYADNAQFMLAEIYAVKGRYEMAVDEYHKVTEKYPASELLPQVAQKEYSIASYYWDKGKHKLAVEIFSKVADAYPYNDLAPKAQHRVANFYFIEKKDYAEAIVQYERLIEEFPQQSYLSESVFRLGASYWKESLMWALDQQYTKEAAEQFTRVVVEFPDSPYVSRSKELLVKFDEKIAKKEYKTGYFYYREKNYKAARYYYENVIKNYSETFWVANSLYDIGRTYYREKQWMLASEYFERVKKDFPKRRKITTKAARMLEKCTQNISKNKN